MLSTANDPMLVYCSNENITNINLVEYNANVNGVYNGFCLLVHILPTLKVLVFYLAYKY